MSCSKGVKDPLEVPEVRLVSLETPQRKWASSRLERRTSWIFSSCGWCSRLKTGTSGTRSGGLRKGQSPCELLGGLSGLHSRRSRGLRSCVELVPEPEDSSPVLTWILRTSGVSPVESVLVSSGGMHVRFHPELQQQCHASLRVDQGICGFPSRLSLEAFPRGFPTRLSHEDFPRGFPTRLSHRAVPRATVV